MKQEAEKYLKFKNDGTYFQQLQEKEETKEGDDDGESGNESDVEPEPEKKLKVEGKDGSVSKAENEEKIEKGNNEKNDADAGEK